MRVYFAGGSVLGKNRIQGKKKESFFAEADIDGRLLSYHYLATNEFSSLDTMKEIMEFNKTQTEEDTNE